MKIGRYYIFLSKENTDQSTSRTINHISICFLCDLNDCQLARHDQQEIKHFVSLAKTLDRYCKRHTSSFRPKSWKEKTVVQHMI